MNSFILKYFSFLLFFSLIKLQNLNQKLLIKNNIETFDKGKYRILNSTNNIETNNNIKIIEPYQYHFINETIFVNRKTINKIDYLISKINPSDNKMIIEFSMCSGEYGLSFHKYNNIENQKNTSLPFFIRTEIGKKILILENVKDNKIIVSIMPKPNLIISDKKYYFSYMIYYYSTTVDKYKMSFIESTLTFQPIRNGGVKIIIPPIKILDNDMKKISDINNYFFSAFITENSTYYNIMESICNLIKFFDLVDPKKSFRDLKINKNNEITIKEIQKGKSYYANILIRNKNTNELITFKPIVITYNDILFSKLRIALIIILIIIIIISIILILKISNNRIQVLEKEVQNASSSTIKNQSSISYISPSTTDNKL